MPKKYRTLSVSCDNCGDMFNTLEDFTEWRCA